MTSGSCEFVEESRQIEFLFTLVFGFGYGYGTSIISRSTRRHGMISLLFRDALLFPLTALTKVIRINAVSGQEICKWSISKVFRYS